MRDAQRKMDRAKKMVGQSEEKMRRRRMKKRAIMKNRRFLPDRFGVKRLSKPNNFAVPCTYVFIAGLFLRGSQQNYLLCSVSMLPTCISDTLLEYSTNQKLSLKTTSEYVPLNKLIIK
jgi:hypothetical protein